MTDNSSALTNMLLDERIKGLNYFEIEEKHGIPAEEARQIVREALEEVAQKDPFEARGIIQLRLERTVNMLWAGLETGSFKHGEAIIKAAERIAELMDLNEQTIKQTITIVSDEETLKLAQVLKLNNNGLYSRIAKLPLNAKARKELEAWPEWASESITDAIDEVIYAEEVDGVYQ